MHATEGERKGIRHGTVTRRHGDVPDPSFPVDFPPDYKLALVFGGSVAGVTVGHLLAGQVLVRSWVFAVAMLACLMVGLHFAARLESASTAGAAEVTQR
jgi:hypothetical protein